jgi:broad specificity phosphatase PhoE
MPIIYLVRHAQASFGSENYDRLSDLGRQQSRWLGEYFAARGLEFTRVLAGSLVRQRDTAAEILGSMGRPDLQVEEHPGLDEYPGEALYKAFAARDPVEHQRADYRDYWRTFRAAMQAWTQDRLQDVPETWAQFGARIQQALETATQGAAREDALLVVSSGGAIGRAIADIVQSPADIAIELNLQFRNTGFCELLASPGKLRLLSFNSIAHLETSERRSAITFA